MRRGTLALLLLPTAAAAATFAHPSGRRGAAGTFADPVDVQSCIDAMRAPGDRCLLKGGTYAAGAAAWSVERKVGTRERPMAISSAGDGDVVIDGTAPVTAAWSRDSGATYVAEMPEGQKVWQLFDRDGEMQTPARWPNAFWHDRTVWMAPERWAHSSSGEHDPVKTGKGKLVDAGACANVSQCCSKCNTNSLAGSGVDATGAVIVMNLWANGVGIEKIASHDAGSDTLHYDATWCKATLASGKKCSDGYRGGEGRYFLEGTRNLLDAATEWHFDVGSGKLYYVTADGEAPSGMRTKVSTYAFNITDSSYLTISDLKFFGTTLSSQHSGNLTFDTLDFTYPSASRRALGELAPPEGMQVLPPADAKGHALPSRNTFDNCAWRYADGAAMISTGDGDRLTNCVVEWNRWAIATGSPGEWKNDGAFFASGKAADDESYDNPKYSNMTYRFNGASKTMVSRGEHLVGMHFEGQVEDASDGCYVESGGPESVRMRYSWCTGSGKACARFDGEDSTGTANGEMSYLVVFNNTGLTVKGDNHTVSQNTVFLGSDIGASESTRSWPGALEPGAPLDYCGPSNSITIENPGPRSPKADMRSTFTGNIFDRVAHWKDCNRTDCPFAGTWADNLIGSAEYVGSAPAGTGGVPKIGAFDIRTQLRDPLNRDFRACPGSAAAALQAGAYPVYTRGDTRYWIPGAREPVASHPSPIDGATAVADAELIFLGAYRAAGHTVYLGTSAAGVAKVAELARDDNVAAPPLKPRTRYWWRVDAAMPSGTRTGPTWSFTTSANTSCPSAPVAGFVPPPSAGCLDELRRLCGDNRRKSASACVHCTGRHAGDLPQSVCANQAQDFDQFCSSCGGQPLRGQVDPF